MTKYHLNVFPVFSFTNLKHLYGHNVIYCKRKLTIFVKFVYRETKLKIFFSMPQSNTAAEIVYGSQRRLAKLLFLSYQKKRYKFGFSETMAFK